ncbi:RNA-binding protein [Brevundimonas staleyi]|uniref:RNA-binding protein n=1 Tax=Brevundimonas staleyi TaxID=74326 RepID=A0ABW0FUB5_9CAUL
MSRTEVFLDDTPGEVRGIVSRDGRFERLIIQREDEPPQNRLGARVVGRVLEPEGAFKAAFVDIGGDKAGFLPLGKGEAIRTGDIIEAEVTAEPRETKGPVLKRIGAGEGKPRLLAPGPDVAERLRILAPGVAPITGVEAIQASWDAEEEALAASDFFAEWALDVAVQRTRALIAVDIDYVHLQGRDARKGRARANQEGLKQAARLIRLCGWGGLVAVDLVGTALDPVQVTAMAKSAFAGDDANFGPVSRFGLLQLALTWRTTPVEEILNAGGRRAPTTRAIDLVRYLRHAMLSDTTIARFVARCAPEEAAIAAPLVARLGPRANLAADPAVQPGRFTIDEG